jgi:transposase
MAKAKKTRHRKMDRSLPVMRPNAGGIDIGATEIFVAVPADRDVESVRSFSTFTEDLHKLADWLQQCRVDTVAMESTGVYWIPLFQILEARGIEVHLVMLNMCTTSLAENPTSWIASGYSICIRLAC